MMFCRKCGSTIQSDSVFCSNCGIKVDSVKNLDNTIQTVDTDFSLDDALEKKELDVLSHENGSEELNDAEKKITPEISGKTSRKISKISWIAISTAVFVIICFIYNINYQKALLDAKKLYSEGEYFDAADKLNGYFAFGNDDEINKIRFSGKVGMYYMLYKNSLSRINSWGSDDYARGFENLILGLHSCVVSEKNATTEIEKSIIKDFRLKYFSALESMFDTSESIAIRMSELSYKEIQDQAKYIGDKISKVKVEQNYKNENPIEFKDISLKESNSLYTVATGTAYNISNRTVKFVTIKVSFKDNSGNVIDTSSTYAVGSEGLKPGESTKWSASVDRDNNIKSVSVSIIKFD